MAVYADVGGVRDVSFVLSNNVLFTMRCVTNRSVEAEVKVMSP